MLTIENLRVAFATRTGPVDAVRGVSLAVGREKLGIVGESGSGKSTVGRAIMGLLPHSAVVTADRMEFEGLDLRNATRAQWRDLRGGRIGMVLQDPKYSLNPVIRVGEQIAESLRDHQGLRGRKPACACASCSRPCASATRAASPPRGPTSCPAAWASA